MGIRKYKPTTPGRRGSSVADFVEITRSTPEKSLVRPLHSKGGRNNAGRVTARHQGGGHKRAYRLIDFRRNDKDGVPAKVAHIEYDPNRTARIALLHYADGEKRYIIAPNKLKQGDRIETGPAADIKPGNNLPLRNIPVGTVIHAIELRPGGGAKIARSAGTSVQLVAKDGPYAQLRMPSGEIRNVDARCRAIIISPDLEIGWSIDRPVAGIGRNNDRVLDNCPLRKGNGAGGQKNHVAHGRCVDRQRSGGTVGDIDIAGLETPGCKLVFVQTPNVRPADPGGDIFGIRVRELGDDIRKLVDKPHLVGALAQGRAQAVVRAPTRVWQDDAFLIWHRHDRASLEGVVAIQLHMGVRVDAEPTPEFVVRLDIDNAISHEAFAQAGGAIGHEDRIDRYVPLGKSDELQKKTRDRVGTRGELVGRDEDGRAGILVNGKTLVGKIEASKVNVGNLQHIAITAGRHRRIRDSERRDLGVIGRFGVTIVKRRMGGCIGGDLEPGLIVDQMRHIDRETSHDQNRHEHIEAEDRDPAPLVVNPVLKRFSQPPHPTTPHNGWTGPRYRNRSGN